jgi:hypothetical protein
MKLLQALIEAYPETEFLIADGFDDAVIGYHQQSERLIYSIRKCIDILIEEGMDEEDALEHFYYNVEGSYVGEKTPIWADDTVYCGDYDGGGKIF